jgi:hypothetical protein
MKKAIILASGTNIVTLSPDQNLPAVAAAFNVVDPNSYAEFEEEEFDCLCYKYPSAFRLVAGLVSFNLDDAKIIAKSFLTAKSRIKSSANITGLDPLVYMAQCTMPPEIRSPEYQAAIEKNNQLAAEMSDNSRKIDSAKTLKEVDEILEDWNRITNVS